MEVAAATCTLLAAVALPVSSSAAAARSATKQSYSRRKTTAVRAVMARPHQVPPPATATATTYRDNWFDKLAIGYLSRNLQEASGMKNRKDGYEGLIEAALAISALFRVDQQWDTVASALQRAFPSYILTMIKVMMPPSRFSREYFAAFTTVFFPWLVGPCEGIPSGWKGREERGLHTQMQISGKHQLCRNVHEPLQNPMPEVHPGFTWHGCLHVSQF